MTSRGSHMPVVGGRGGGGWMYQPTKTIHVNIDSSTTCCNTGQPAEQAIERCAGTTWCSATHGHRGVHTEVQALHVPLDTYRRNKAPRVSA